MAFVTFFYYQSLVCYVQVQLKHLQIQYFTLSSLNFHIQWDAHIKMYWVWLIFQTLYLLFFQRGSTIFSSLTLNIKNK